MPAKTGSKQKQKPMSVVTLPLRVEPWQADIIDKRMDLCRRVYNDLLDKKLEALHSLESDEAYRQAVTEIEEVYRITDDEARKKRMKSESFKKSRLTSASMLKASGICDYAFIDRKSVV